MIRERLEAMLRPNADGISPCDHCASWIKNQQLIRALLAAIEQRGHGYAYVWNVLGDKAKADLDARLKRDDARLLAILEGRES